MAEAAEKLTAAFDRSSAESVQVFGEVGTVSIEREKSASFNLKVAIAGDRGAVFALKISVNNLSQAERAVFVPGVLFGFVGPPDYAEPSISAVTFDSWTSEPDKHVFFLFNESNLRHGYRRRALMLYLGATTWLPLVCVLTPLVALTWLPLNASRYGFSRLLSVPRAVPWLVAMVIAIREFVSANYVGQPDGYYVFLVGFIIINAIATLLDLVDAIRWIRGERAEHINTGFFEAAQ